MSFRGRTGRALGFSLFHVPKHSWSLCGVQVCIMPREIAESPYCTAVPGGQNWILLPFLSQHSKYWLKG